MEVKTTYRLAVGDQYEFVEVEEHAPPSKERRDELIAEFRSSTEGLPPAEWREILDGFLWLGEGIEADTYMAMSDTQKAVIQEIKKSKKRGIYKDMIEATLDEVERIRSINEE